MHFALKKGKANIKRDIVRVRKRRIQMRTRRADEEFGSEPAACRRPIRLPLPTRSQRLGASLCFRLAGSWRVVSCRYTFAARFHKSLHYNDTFWITRWNNTLSERNYKLTWDRFAGAVDTAHLCLLSFKWTGKFRITVRFEKVSSVTEIQLKRLMFNFYPWMKRGMLFDSMRMQEQKHYA